MQFGVSDAQLTNEQRQVIHRAITKASFPPLPKATKDFKTGLSNSAHPACSAWLPMRAAQKQRYYQQRYYRAGLWIGVDKMLAPLRETVKI